MATFELGEKCFGKQGNGGASSLAEDDVVSADGFGFVNDDHLHLEPCLHIYLQLHLQCGVR